MFPGGGVPRGEEVEYTGDQQYRTTKAELRELERCGGGRRAATQRGGCAPLYAAVVEAAGSSQVGCPCVNEPPPPPRIGKSWTE